MTNQEILEKAIQKATEKGYDKPLTVHLVLEGTLDACCLWTDHDFAKALWGEEDVVYAQYDSGFGELTRPAWEAHLQRMVITDDPIKYLGDNI